MEPENGREVKGGLGRVAFIGSVLQMGSRGLRALLGVFSLGILSRFLSPAEFGAFALIFFLILLVQLLADFGLRVALVQKPEVTQLEMSSVFWFSVALSTGISLIVWLAATPIAALLGDVSVSRYVEMVAPAFAIMSLRGVPLAVLERQFRFGQIATSELLAALVGAGTAIAFAVAGGSVESLVFQQLAMVAVNVGVTMWFAKWRPLPQFSLAAIRPMMGFGTSVTMTALIQFTAGYIDRPVIGSRLPASDLGYLTVAHQTVMTPVRTVVQNMRRVTFPLMSSVQTDTGRVAGAHLATLHMLFLVLAPICAGLSALAGPATRILLGPGWGPAAMVISVFSIMTLIGSIAEANAAIFSARGRVKFLFYWSIFSLIANLGSLLLVVDYGLEAIAWTRCALVVLLLVPVQSWFAARELEIGQGAIPSAVWRPTLAAALMGVLVHGADLWMEARGHGAIVRLLVGVPLGGALYGVAVFLIDRQAVLRLLERLRAMRRR
jgi:PST family polysaccharide transporter